MTSRVDDDWWWQKDYWRQSALCWETGAILSCMWHPVVHIEHGVLCPLGLVEEGGIRRDWALADAHRESPPHSLLAVEWMDCLLCVASPLFGAREEIRESGLHVSCEACTLSFWSLHYYCGCVRVISLILHFITYHACMDYWMVRDFVWCSWCEWLYWTCDDPMWSVMYVILRCEWSCWTWDSQRWLDIYIMLLIWAMVLDM